MKKSIFITSLLGGLLAVSSQGALVAYWSLDGDADADFGGWGSSTTEGAGATVSFVNDAPSQINTTRSVAFADGNSQLIRTGFDASAAGLTGSNPTFTVSYWFKVTGDGVDATQRDMISIADGSATGGGQVAWFDFETGDDIKVFYNNGRTSTTVADGGPGGVIDWDSGNDNSWHHLALVYSSTHGGSTLYLDGVDVGSAVNPSNTLNFPATAFLSIGGTYNGTNSSITRLIDDIQIADLAVWDEALAPATISGLADGSIQVIPEPTTATLFAGGLAALCFTRRRK